MFGIDDFLLFAAISDAEEEERERHEEAWQQPETECEPTVSCWEKSQQQATNDSERDWYRREREQAEWEMRNADFYGFDKDEIRQRMDYLDDRERTLD